MTRHLLTLTAVFSILCVVAQAGPRSCRIVFPERANNSPKSAYLFDGNKSIPVTLPSMNLSEVIELPAGDLTIAMTSREINDPKLLPADAPLLEIPAAMADLYIILTPDPKSPEFPFKMSALNAGGDALKPGHALWVNLTGHRIAVELADLKISMDPMQQTTSGPPLSASGYFAARFTYQQNGEGAFASITEQSWWYDVRCRHLGIIMNTGAKLPKICFLRDFRTPAADDANPR